MEHFIGIGGFHRNRKSSWIWTVFIGWRSFSSDRAGLLRDMGCFSSDSKNGLQIKSFWIWMVFQLDREVFRILDQWFFRILNLSLSLDRIGGLSLDWMFFSGFHRIRTHLSKAPYIY